MELATTAAAILFSILFPTKGWFAPNEPITIDVRPADVSGGGGGAGGVVTLVLTDFAGRPFESKGAVDVAERKTVNVRELFDTLRAPGTYILSAVPKGADGGGRFVGTPLVIQVRRDARRDAPPDPMVVRVVPLCYAVISTDKGDMTVGFYYDVAPNTVESFLSLATEGFFDGLAFHRIVPEFIIQSGDPKGDGTGGPGFQVAAEFSDRPHDAGVLSMAREHDPIEKQGALPRPEFANSGGGQFFISLKRTPQLDRRFTVFGKVTDGLEVVESIGKTPVGGETGDVPSEKVMIRSVKVLPVTAENNPYQSLLRVAEEATTQPGE